MDLQNLASAEPKVFLNPSSKAATTACKKFWKFAKCSCRFVLC